ncbi:hypothetical protein ACUOFC_23185, partial [Escherichia sp. TWPC-MK]
FHTQFTHHAGYSVGSKNTHQRKVESRNFDIRKQLLEYDDVANDQRRAIYSQRNELLDVSDVSETINSIREDVFKATIDAYIPPQSLEEMWDIPGLQERLKNDFDLDLPIAEWLDKEPELHEETLRERILAQSIEVYQRKEEVVGAEMMRHFEKGVMLQTLDSSCSSGSLSSHSAIGKSRSKS